MLVHHLRFKAEEPWGEMVPMSKREHVKMFFYGISYSKALPGMLIRISNNLMCRRCAKFAKKIQSQAL